MKFFLGLLLFLSFLTSCSKKYVNNEYLSRELAFTRFFVLPLIKQDLDISPEGEFIQEKLISETKRLGGFKVHGSSYTRNFLSDNKIISSDFLKIETMKKIAVDTKSDALLLSMLGSDYIKLSIYSPLTGRELISDQEKLPEKYNAQTLKALLFLILKRVLSYVPFDAVVLNIKKDRIMISAGRLKGLKKNRRITIYKIISFSQRTPGYEAIKVPVARAVVKRVNKYTSIAKITHHNQQFAIEKYLKVSTIDFFHPIENDQTE